MTTARTARRMAAAAAPLLLTLSGFGLTAPAQAAGPQIAATPLTATVVDCSLDGAMPGKVNVTQFDCTAAADGGTGGYSYAWAGVSYASFFFNANADDAWGMCNAGQHATVQVTVTDSSGATATGRATFLCSGF
jgi:hypothetical protein